VPPLPKIAEGVGPEAREAWAGLWASVVRGAVDMAADADLLAEYVLLVDERERLRQAMAEGLTGPVVTRMGMVERHLMKLREHLGLTPLARFRLQLSVVTSREAMGRLAEREAAREPAPRVVVIEEAIPEPWRPGGSQAGPDTGGDGDAGNDGEADAAAGP
jgi:hypothetical protein